MLSLDLRAVRLANPKNITISVLRHNGRWARRAAMVPSRDVGLARSRGQLRLRRGLREAVGEGHLDQLLRRHGAGQLADDLCWDRDWGGVLGIRFV